MASASSCRRAVSCGADLEVVASKAGPATFVIPELEDEENPDGWQVMGASTKRVVATVRQFLEHALYDLSYGIPGELRSHPAVEEQRQQLRGLLEGRDGSWPFTVVLQDATRPGPEDTSVAATRYSESDDGRGSEFHEAGSVEGGCEPIDRQLGLDAPQEDSQAAEEEEAVELGAPETLKRCVIAPGNGGGAIRDANWYGWLHDELVKAGVFREVICQDFPEPEEAPREVWLPFLCNDLRVGPDTILVGHSSGAEAAMRLAEENPVGGLVLVAACHTDLGDEGERASGYYPPGGGPWRWDRIRKNAGWIVQFHSDDDFLVPVEEGRFVAKQLQSEYHELEGHEHFFEPFRELPEAILGKLPPKGS